MGEKGGGLLLRRTMPRVNVEGVLELEDYHFATIIIKPQSGKNHQ